MALEQAENLVYLTRREWCLIGNLRERQYLIVSRVEDVSGRQEVLLCDGVVSWDRRHDMGNDPSVRMTVRVATVIAEYAD